MSELTVLFFAIFFKSLCLIAAIAGATFLIYHNKDGWGWLIFLAIIVGSTSYKYTPDEKKENPVESTTKDA